MVLSLCSGVSFQIFHQNGQSLCGIQKTLQQFFDMLIIHNHCHYGNSSSNGIMTISAKFAYKLTPRN